MGGLAAYKPALVLMAVTVIAAATLGIIHDITKGPIEEQLRIYETNLVGELLPGTQNLEETEVTEAGAVTKIILGYGEEGELTGYVVSATVSGYAGDIDIIAGFGTDGGLTGIRIVNQRETPGLGSEIASADFLAQFAGREIVSDGESRLLTVTKMRGNAKPDEIEALVSATISTSAVVEGVNAAIDYFVNNIKVR